jgi:hypothetical protein
MKRLVPRKRKIPWIEDWGSSASFGVLGVAFTLQSFRVEKVAFGMYVVAAGLGLVSWMAHLRRFRVISDTPTSRIASAAQGYVELTGRAAPMDGRLVRSVLTETPCLWYRSHAWYRQTGDPRRGFEEHESEAPFLLLDGEGRGQCLIDPQGAEFFIMRKNQWRVPPGNSKHSDEFIEWLLLPDDAIHAVGEFTSGADGTHDRMVKPRHGQPYLIGNISARYLGWRHMGLALFNLAMFFVSLGLCSRLGLLPL